MRLFCDYGDRRFLVGYCRYDKWNWIKTNKLYNIRMESAKRRGGVDENDPLSYAVDYIILYKNRQRNQYHIYRVDHYEHVSQEGMRLKGYTDPHSDYLVFSLEEEVKFENIDLKLLLQEETGEVSRA